MARAEFGLLAAEPTFAAGDFMPFLGAQARSGFNLATTANTGSAGSAAGEDRGKTQAGAGDSAEPVDVPTNISQIGAAVRAHHRVVAQLATASVPIYALSSTLPGLGLPRARGGFH